MNTQDSYSDQADRWNDNMHEKEIRLNSEYLKTIRKLLPGFTDQQIGEFIQTIGRLFIDEIGRGLEGDVDYSDAPFFEIVDQMYEELEPKECYFCDRKIDGNETPFDYPENTRLCLSCQLKVANLLKAFGLEPRSLFPALGERKVQKVIYERLPDVKRPDGVSVH